MNIAISGAGLVGSLLAIYLARRGYRVTVFERRPDMRATSVDRGRSINLALSNRGIRALNEVGLADEIRKNAIPMHGRMMHDLNGGLSYLPYGKEGQYINSISRGGLNEVLLTAAEAAGVNIRFQCAVQRADLNDGSLFFEQHGPWEPRLKHERFDRIIGGDGAFSAIRSEFMKLPRFNYSQDYIEHGYKELSIPAGQDGSFQLEPNALHIWPRESYMLIALPNPDRSFTCTLFFPFEGTPSFKNLNDDTEVSRFFKSAFPDAAGLMPTLTSDFKTNPTSTLLTVRCHPWVHGRGLLLGDAAHAIVPFFGQGMNAGFEDCRVLNELLDQHKDDWGRALDEFQQLRKADADAIAQLALDNFIEMRDLVSDPGFLLRKKIEARIHALYPDRWVPLYSMVTFLDTIRYSEALVTGQRQKTIMDRVMALPGIAQDWETIDYAPILDGVAATFPTSGRK
jgi:kynurenine 3-monooxygenase